jgi:hypothetical protein
MNRTKIVRSLRIAFSATCGIAVVLICLLWVRSYWWLDEATGPVSKTDRLMLGSLTGWLQFRLEDRSGESYQKARWIINRKSVDSLYANISATNPSFRPIRESARFGFRRDTFFMPYWFPVILAAAFTALPWMRWRYSLKTLMIGTTLFAVLLGTVIAITR